MIAESKSISRRIKRFLVLQKSTVKYYDKAAFITTEADLKKVLKDMSADHLEIQKALMAQLFDERPLLRSFRRVITYFEKVWKNFAKALVINNQRKILEYIWQSECKMLQEIQPLRVHYKADANLSQLFKEYENNIYQHLEVLDNMVKKTNPSGLVV